MKNTWKVIKQAMNISNNKLKISKIRSNNKIIEDWKNIVNIFNEHFSTIGANLAQNIPTNNKHFFFRIPRSTQS